ncbi:MAG: hypothetical protein SAK29_22455 [Scytonema sp. PMC 1069.18]|nr:hypothetical protein [Scytonema sp. PMC 1069.18]MEC4879722.1 hypothetical protein [Scytonema sp. PMC 1070.18]
MVIRILIYTNAAGIEDAEISLKHLVTNVSQDIDITVVGTCQVVVDTIAHSRPQASQVVLPRKVFLVSLHICKLSIACVPT